MSIQIVSQLIQSGQISSQRRQSFQSTSRKSKVKPRRVVGSVSPQNFGDAVQVSRQ